MPSFKFQSADWSTPNGFVQDSGVLITRIRPGEYGVFMNGHWKLMSLDQWQQQFDTRLPAGLPSGWWGAIDKIETRNGTYQDNFTAKTLTDALRGAQKQLLGAYAPRPYRAVAV